MKMIFYVLVITALWMAAQIEMDSYNPCSNFSNRPGDCSSRESE